MALALLVEAVRLQQQSAFLSSRYDYLLIDYSIGLQRLQTFLCAVSITIF